MGRIALTAVSLLFPVSLYAQWFDWRTPGIPRTADGKPNLTAPAPRTPDGKPDLSGVWRAASNPYRFNVIQDLKDEAIFRPAAQAVFMARVKDFRRDDPETNCLPAGPSETLNITYRIVQAPELVALLFESLTGRYRQIYTDGRTLPTDPNPTWMGYSVGRWEGETFVVESNGFNDRTWLDRVGHPHSESLHVTETFRRIDFGHIQYQITFDDPETLTKPLTIPLTVTYAADTDMLESVCNENNNPSKAHMVATEPTAVELSSDVLARYVGTYRIGGESRVAGLLGATLKVSIVKDRLYLNTLPLIPTSDTTFDSTAGGVQFDLDVNRAVTRMIVDTPGVVGFYFPVR